LKADDVTEKEVTAIINKFIETYSKRDMEGLTSLIAPDPDVCLFDIEPDEKWVGLNAIEIQLTSDWSQYEASSYEINWIKVSAAGVVAWIASEVHFKVKSKGHSLIFPCYATAVLEKRGDKWFIMQGHFSMPEVKQYSSLI
jgi:ketosteroid isomerase-like protein